MNEERTRDLLDRHSFEERVFARFDSMETGFDSMDTRFDSMETRVNAMELRFDSRFDRVEARAFDAKSIWEQALAEIIEVKESVYDIKRKFEIVTEDLIQVRADQRRIEKRMDRLESRPQY